MDLDSNLPSVHCSPAEFNQVVLNMVVNAAHAIADVVGDGGKGKGKIRVKTRPEGEWAIVEISDTGAGMPAHIQQRIFEPFFTTKEVGKGTGQGLAIAHNVIVDKHGGTIKVVSAPGKGTTFVIRLPMGGPKTEAEAPAGAAA
jgi:signal transduction histidine kinase